MKLAIIGNVQKPGLRDTVGLLIAQLDAVGIDYVVDEMVFALPGGEGSGVSSSHARSFADCINEADMIIAFGGDGTILAAAREVGARGTPILGVNLGKLGFLAELRPEEMQEAIGALLKQQYVVEDRLVLEATLPSLPGKVFRALNDVVIDKSRMPRLIDLETHIDGAFAVSYRADGLIVSTPTGSTAYALSNGGPIVTPTSNVIGITPISPHTLSGRPLVVPDSSTIRVVVHSDSEEVLVSIDGQVNSFLRPPIEVTIRKASHSVRLVKRVDRSYFDVLRAKLFWGKDARST